MSSWQSFFNELTRTSKQGIQATSNVICQCERGKLIAINDSNFETSINCSLGLFCSIIQIDKHRAKTYSNGFSIIPQVGMDEDFTNNKILLLDHLLEKRSI